MKLIIAIIVVFALLNAAFAAPQKKGDMCGLCVQFADEALEQLIDIIANVGIAGGCGKLCSHLPAKLEAEACDVICEIVGIEEFVKAIQKADLDPIFYCQELKLCPIDDCTGQCAKINGVTSVPTKGQSGTTFNIVIDFTVMNKTGTGEFAINIAPPDGMPFGTGELAANGYVPGNFQMKVGVKTQPSENEPFGPGVYKIQTAICEGQCGSKHPHSRIFSEANGQFTITGQ